MSFHRSMMLKLERKMRMVYLVSILSRLSFDKVLFICPKFLERGDYMPGPESQTKQINERREECDDHPELRLI